MASDQHIVSGSTVWGSAYQVDARMLGGFVTGSAGEYVALPVAPKTQYSDASPGLYLSASFASYSGSIIAAMNKLASDISNDSGGDVTRDGALTANMLTYGADGAYGISTGDIQVNDDNVDLPSGKVFKIDGDSVLEGDKLGDGVLASSLTSVGTLAALQVDNINLNGSAIVGSTAADLTIDVTDGQSVVIEGVDIDDGVVTGASSITSTAFVGDLTGDVTGDCSGTAATVTGAAQTAITSVGTLTALQVDNINLNGSAIVGSTAADLTIDVTDGQAVVVEGVSIDDGVVTGASSITSTAFVGALTGNADTATKIASITNSNIVQLTDTQTLTNKTLTTPDINTPDIDGGTIDGVTLGGTLAGTPIFSGECEFSGGMELSGATTMTIGAGVTVTNAAENTFTGQATFGSSGASSLLISGTDAATGATKSYKIEVLGGILKATEQAGT